MTTPTLPTIIAADAVAPQPWRNGGGQTRELLAWPDAQDWQMRISRADIAQDGPFSAFPGVQRWFAVLEGAGVTLRMPGAARRIARGAEPLYFDGGDAPGCTLIDGPTQDLNLMLRGASGRMQAVQPGVAWHADHRLRALYTTSAGRWWDSAGQQLQLAAHQLLWSPESDRHAWFFEPQAGTPGGPAFWIGATPTPR